MARIGDVWDSTTDVLAGRAGLIAPVAAGAVFVPQSLQRAVRIFGDQSPGIAALALLIGLAALVANLWAGLTIIAIASDPTTTREAAGRQALARLSANLLVVVVLVGAVVLLAMPPIVALAATGFDFTAATAASAGTGTMPAVAPGVGGFIALYALAVFVLALWASSRLFLVNTIVLNEKRALGALGRSVALTRGLTWRLIGVAILFGIVLLVASSAAALIVGIVTRLALGPDQIKLALFLASIASAAVQTAFVAMVQVFAARLYAAVTGGVARAPEQPAAATGPWG